MRIFVGQINPTIGDFEGNTKKILKNIQDARAQNADVVLFPELAICGYPPEDLLLHDSFVDAIPPCLEMIQAASANLFIVVGLVRRNLSSGEKPIFNSAAIIHDKKLLGFHDKWLLPTYDVFDERRYFEPGSTLKVWDMKGKKVAVLICEDIWQHAGYVGYTRYQKDPVAELMKQPIDLMVNLSSSPYHYQKPDMRVKVCAKSAKTLRCPVIMCCQVGSNDALVFDGYSSYVDKEGHLQQLAKGFEEDGMLVDLSAPLKKVSFKYQPLNDLYHALTLGIKDYFRKQGFTKACLGLSGGIDSALVACIAVEALGKDNVLAIAMPSRYSSPSSIKDAEDLAKNLGIRLEKIPIEKPFTEYLQLLKPLFDDMPQDITEENLQARIRGMLLMAISNKLGYIVLSTGNKSEMAMGYCTLYGDMCGGLGVISDVTKTLVYELSHWINRDKEIIPKSSLEKPPSAELRPNQKDIDTLPEYNIVDTVLEAYVQERLSIEEIVQKHRLPLELVSELVKKIHRAEYKRRQAPPGIRVSQKAFSVGRRYPIVQCWK